MTQTWDEETIATLREGWFNGDPVGRIAARIKVSRDSVLGKAHRLGLPARPSPIKRGRPPADAPDPVRVPRAPRVTIPSLVDVDMSAFERPAVHAREPGCSWVISDGRPWIRCDAPLCAESRNYCAEHHAQAFVRAGRRKETT